MEEGGSILHPGLPSRLIWQGIAPHLFLADFIDRVYHVHMKDAAVRRGI